MTEREEERFERIYIVPSEIFKGQGSILFPCGVEATLHDLSPTLTSLKVYSTRQEGFVKGIMLRREWKLVK